jgi:hypothetical protein
MTAALRRIVALQFVIANLGAMTSAQAVRDFPNPTRRVDHLLTSWQDGVLRRRGWTREAAVARTRLLYAALDHAAAQRGPPGA